MRFALCSSIACVITAAVAQSIFRESPKRPEWLHGDSRGAASDLNKGTVIAFSIPNSGSYTFTLPADTIRNSDYTIEISADGNPSAVNYTPQFVVESTNTIESISPSGITSATAATTMATPASTPLSSATSTGSSLEKDMPSKTSAKSVITSLSRTTGLSSLSLAASTTSGSTTSSSRSSTSSNTSASATPMVAAAPSSGTNMLNVKGSVVAMILGVVVAV